MIKEQRKYCYGVYTLMFLLMCIVAFLPFFTEGKSFVWGAGVEDGLSQHFSALAYYGEALREFFRNLLAGHPKLVMWDMSLGYGADILSHDYHPLSLILLSSRFLSLKKARFL